MPAEAEVAAAGEVASVIFSGHAMAARFITCRAAEFTPSGREAAVVATRPRPRQSAEASAADAGAAAVVLP